MTSREEVEAAVAQLGRVAAQVDVAEGGHRVGLNVMALLAWAANLKVEHAACGKLTLEKDAAGNAAATLCPVHGRFEAPEWVEP